MPTLHHEHKINLNRCNRAFKMASYSTKTNTREMTRMSNTHIHTQVIILRKCIKAKRPILSNVIMQTLYTLTEKQTYTYICVESVDFFLMSSWSGLFTDSICELFKYIGKESRMVSHRLLHSFESIAVLLLEWLPSNATESGLPYYLTHIWVQKRRIHAFPKYINVKVKKIRLLIYLF